MSQQTQRLWRQPPDPLGALRDLGSVDISIQVTVSARNDEQQTPTVLLALNAVQWRNIGRVLLRADLSRYELGDVSHAGDGVMRLTTTVDDCSHLAQLLDDDGHWSDTVTALRKALGLAGCWVELQAGP